MKAKIIKLARVLMMIAFFIIPLMFSRKAIADIAHPDTTPTLSPIYANRNLVENGDTLIYALYNIPYGTLPSVDADQTFLFRLISTNGTTELGVNSPYVYFESRGYNKGLISFYFGPSEITWGSSYIIRITENPGQFDDPLSWDFTISASNYSEFTDQEDNQDELGDNLYDMAQTLESAYNITLFERQGGSQVLSVDGEEYFLGVIPGLMVMCPTIFYLQPREFTPSTTNYTLEKATEYELRYSNTWVGESENTTAEEVVGGTPNMTMLLFVIGPLCIAFIIASAIKLKHTEPGLLVSGLILILGLMEGWIPPAIFGSAYQLMGIYSAYLIFYARG